MADMAYIASRALEKKIAIAESDGLNTVFVPLIMMKEILAILKEQQKPVKPTRLLNEKVVSYNNVVYQYSCGNCSTLLRNSWKACPLCGKMVKWDD